MSVHVNINKDFPIFRHGAYYAVDAISDEMAVISFNTMYFYEVNKDLE